MIYQSMYDPFSPGRFAVVERSMQAFDGARNRTFPLRRLASKGTGWNLPDHPSLSFKRRQRQARLHIPNESPG
jgi:hypothetical protein